MSNSEHRYKCRDCGMDFIFCKAEQDYFNTKKLKNPPQRCHNCRVLRRAELSDEQSHHISALVCASCYSLTYVPFKPNGQKPIYCVECYYSRKLELCV